MKDRSSGRLAMVGVYALMLCTCVALAASFLRTLGLNDDAYRLIRELFTQHATASCSFVLYMVLYAALIVRAWASYKNHHHIKWFSLGNIALTAVVYGACAFLLSVNGHPILMDAALNPLFWMIYNISGVLLYTAAIIGSCTVAYGAFCVVRSLLRKRRTDKNENEINPLVQELSELEYPLDHPRLYEAYVALLKERDGTDNV